MNATRDDIAAARRDRQLLNDVHTAVGLLTKARDLHELELTLGSYSDETRERLRKLRTRARSLIISGLEEERASHARGGV